MRRWLGVALVAVLVTVAAVLVLTGGEAPTADRTTAVPAVGSAATLAVSPVRSVVGGSGASITYTLGNDGPISRTYAVAAAELGPDGQPAADSATAARWVSVSRPQVVVPPHTSATTAVTVRPARNRGASERRIGVTFTDVTPSTSGSVTVRARITTSVYVEGTGPSLRRARLTDLRLPVLARDQIDVTANLVNSGTVSLVPGSTTDPVVATMSHGSPFSLGGLVAPAGTTVVVRGTNRDLPLACWCQVRIAAPDGKGGTTELSGRVLVLPWPWLAASLLVLVVLAEVGIRRRRTTASGEPDVWGVADDRVSRRPRRAHRSRHRRRTRGPGRSSG